MTRVFHRYPKQAMPVATAGEGVYLIDQSGKRYLDACGGTAVLCLGHGPRRVIDAIKLQADELAYARSSFFTTVAAEALAQRLVDAAPLGLEHVYYLSGGSEAVETALKMARQYFVEIRQPKRARFIARRSTRRLHQSSSSCLLTARLHGP